VEEAARKIAANGTPVETTQLTGLVLGREHGIPDQIDTSLCYSSHSCASFLCLRTAFFRALGRTPSSNQTSHLLALSETLC
jgi:hypothetical protein